MSRRSNNANYDFGPYEDEYRGFELSDDDSGRGPLILMLAMGVLLIFAGVVWNTYRQGVRPTEGGVPIIAAEQSPYKRAPDEQGGFSVSDQDKEFYGLLEGEATASLSAELEEPVLAEAEVEDQPLAGAYEPTLIPDPEPVLRGSTSGEVQIATLRPEEEREPSVREALVETAPAQTLSTASRFSSSGRYEVQLLASRSEAATRAEWDRIRIRNRALYQGANLHVQRADLQAKGVFYRLRLGSFESREAGQAFCADVKATGNDCIVVAKVSG